MLRITAQRNETRLRDSRRLLVYSRIWSTRSWPSEPASSPSLLLPFTKNDRAGPARPGQVQLINHVLWLAAGSIRQWRWDGFHDFNWLELHSLQLASKKASQLLLMASVLQISSSQARQLHSSAPPMHGLISLTTLMSHSVTSFRVSGLSCRSSMV